mgnify:CR=1 FL=1
MGMQEWIAAGRAIARGHLARHGKEARFTNAFEQRLAEVTGARHAPVSYTHLTLPTICSV